MHDWHENYIGKPWEAVPNPPHSYTCGELVRAVYRDVHGIDSAEVLANARILKECVQAMQPERFGLEPVTDNPKEFDVAFLLRAKKEDHVGIAVQTLDGLMIMHCQQGTGTVLSSPFEILSSGYRKINWYRHSKLV